VIHEQSVEGSGALLCCGYKLQKPFAVFQACARTSLSASDIFIDNVPVLPGCQAPAVPKLVLRRCIPLQVARKSCVNSTSGIDRPKRLTSAMFRPITFIWHSTLSNEPARAGIT